MTPEPVTEALVNAFVHRDYTMYGSEVHVDIYPDRLEIVSPGGMPDGSLVQELDLRNVASDRRNPILADLFAQMDYMERKGSGFGTILDAYEKEAPNPRGLKPEFFSSSGSFRVVLPNLNSGGASETSQHPDPESVASHEAASETINETISETIKSRPGITRAELIALLGRSRSTVARAIANLVATGKIERRGSKKTGGYFAKDS